MMEDVTRKIEEAVKSTGGETHPVQFDRAFIEFTNGSRTVFQTFCNGNIKPEGQRIAMEYEDRQKCVEDFLHSIQEYIHKVGRGVLYWRIKPEISDYRDCQILPNGGFGDPIGPVKWKAYCRLSYEPMVPTVKSDSMPKELQAA